jgi:hypothetical protein
VKDLKHETNGGRAPPSHAHPTSFIQLQRKKVSGVQYHTIHRLVGIPLVPLDGILIIPISWENIERERESPISVGRRLRTESRMP